MGSVRPTFVETVRAGGGHEASPRTLPVGGWLLLLLLAFTTATVFVREAWALQSFQMGMYVLFAAWLLVLAWRRAEGVELGLTAVLVCCIPLWGILQIAAGLTSSVAATREAVLRWGALAAVFLLAAMCGRRREARQTFLGVFLCFATALAVLCLMQLFTSQGRVLWSFPTGYNEVFGTFQYHNNYAQFVELALPIVLWRALRDRHRSFWYAFAGGILYASVIGSASRSGTLLCTVELLAMLVIGLVRLRDPETGLPSRATSAMLLVVPALAVVLTLVVGWEHVWQRFQQEDPFQGRREFLEAALRMTRDRPLTGHGLGTFPDVYQRFAVRDFPFYANHAHNDWAEFAADGGIPFLLLILIPFAAAVPAAFRHPWALGIVVVMAHACVDYPFPRPAVSGWMFALLGLICAARLRVKADRGEVSPVAGNATARQSTGLNPSSPPVPASDSEETRKKPAGESRQ